MKKILSILLVSIMTFSLTSCFEEIDKTFDEVTYVEFQEAITRTVAVGKTYPLIAVANGAGVMTTTRINLVGRQRPTDTQIKYSIDKNETTAVEGTNFRLTDGGTITIKANESFGTAGIEILRAPAQAGRTVNVVLVLESGVSDILVSENYKRLGFTIRL
ncbi:MAG: DUF4843 domain-containing protein [Spirosomataceae bacterium]